MERGQLPMQVREQEGNILRFVASSDAVDSHGTIIRQRGISFKRFKKNPVFLRDHVARTDHVIGKVVDILKDKQNKRTVVDVEFDINNPENVNARLIYNLYQGGFLKMVSIGFRPTEEYREEKVDGETVPVWRKSELLEISAVAIGSNPDALIQAKSADVISEEEFNLGKRLMENNEEPEFRSVWNEDEEDTKERVVNERHEEQKKLRKFVAKLAKRLNYSMTGDWDNDLDALSVAMKSMQTDTGDPSITSESGRSFDYKEFAEQMVGGI